MFQMGGGTQFENTEKRRFNRKSTVWANVENENKQWNSRDEVNGQWRIKDFVLMGGRI